MSPRAHYAERIALVAEGALYHALAISTFADRAARCRCRRDSVGTGLPHVQLEAQKSRMRDGRGSGASTGSGPGVRHLGAAGYDRAHRGPQARLDERQHVAKCGSGADAVISAIARLHHGPHAERRRPWQT